MAATTAAPNERQVVAQPQFLRQAELSTAGGKPSSYDPKAHTVEVIFATEVRVRRDPWWSDAPFDEILICSEDAVRMERLNAGGPLLDSHGITSGPYSPPVLSDQRGVVLSASASEGLCTALVRFDQATDEGRLLEVRVAAGDVRNVSVRYTVHEWQITERTGEISERRAVDWEPLEVSFLPVPADFNAGTRGFDHSGAWAPCLVRSVTQMAQSTRRTKKNGPGGASGGAQNEEAQNDRQEGAPVQSGGVEDSAGDEAGENRSEPAEGAPAAQPNERSAPPAEQRAEPATAQPAQRAIEAEGPVTIEANQLRALIRDSAASAATEAQRAANERTDAIQELGERHGLEPHTVRDLLRNGEDLAAVRSRVLDLRAAADEVLPVRAQTRIIGEGRETLRNMMERALGARCSHRVRDEHGELTERMMIQDLSSEERSFAAMPLIRVAEECLRASGHRTFGRGPREIAAMALNVHTQNGMRAHTPSDFPGITANVAHNSLQQGYTEAPRRFMPFSRQTTSTDFKEISRTQISSAPDLDEVPDSGIVKLGTLGDRRETFFVKEYGRRFGMTKKLLMNDSIEAFGRLPLAFGMAATRLESNLAFTVLTSNPVMSDGNALFSAAHGNGPDATALGAAGALQGGYQKMALQKAGGTDTSTDFLNLVPRFLVTPPELFETGRQLVTPITNPRATGDVAPFADMLALITEGRLSATSATIWYLAADPSQVDLLEIAFLAGELGPTMESGESLELSGIEFRMLHNVGVAAIDWKGFYQGNA